MRFRRLSAEELKELEQEFIQFLAVSGVEAHDWEQFKISNPTFCEEKIQEFSDVVIGTVLRKTRYAEHKSTNDWLLFKFYENEVSVIIIHTDKLDLTKDVLNEANMDLLTINRTSKPYSTSREDELFKMMQQGCIITDGKIFEAFSSN